MNDLLLKNKIVSNKVNYNIHYSITTTTGNIPEGLPVHYFLKWNVKKVKNGNNKFLQNTLLFLNGRPKINKKRSVICYPA